MGENVVIILVMAAFLVLMLVLGFFFKNKVNTFDDFILGGRGLPWYVIAMTMLATLANAQQILGIAGFSYQTGISFMLWFFIIVNIFIYPIIVRLGARYRGLNLSTIVDFVEERFPGSNRISILLSIWQVVWAVFSTGICLFGGGLLIETVFGIPMMYALLISGTVTVLYCIAGGLNAVVFTDLIDWVIIVAGTAFFVPLVFIKYGTFTAFFSKILGSSGMSPAQGVNLWAGFTDLFTLAPGGMVTVLGLLAMGVAGSLWIPIDLGFMQRMLAAKTVKQGRKACLAFVAIISIWATIMVALGMYARVVFPGVQVTDTVVILLAKEAMPIFGSALFLTAVAAAVMSTVSTYLNAGSAILVKNIYKKFFRSNEKDSHYLAVARICIVIIAVAAAAFAPMVKSGGVFVTALTIQMVICASLTPMVILSTYWKRMTERAAFWGSIISGVITLAVTIKSGGAGAAYSGAGLFGIPTVFIGLIVSIAIYVIMSLLTPYDSKKVGPKFLELYEGRKIDEVKNTDLKVIGTAVVIILVAVIVRVISKKPFNAFPPLSGPFAWLTNWYFILAALAVFGICIYVLIRSIGWVRNINKKVD